MPLPSLELVLGGIGLLLLGMSLLTDGLKLAAGGKLNQSLQRSTRTPTLGLFTGFSLTALVQSSSAVTMATIGFANAGLLTLNQSAWLVFGSNVGTTITGWLVSLIGLDFKIEAFALPLVGIGVLIKLLRPSTRLGAVAGAVAGFGVLFLGLSFLKSAFSNIGDVMSIAPIHELGFQSIIYALLLGAAMTAVMQSSSAAIAIIITAYAQGVFGETIGAALVIGANIGTTVTALLAAIGASANAKRLSLLHVIFNLQTAIVACLLLVPLLWLIAFARDLFGYSGDSAITLALFHTIFNLVGVLLMLPFANRIIGWLERRFTDSDIAISKPQYLDDTALSITETGVIAAYKEIMRVGSMLGSAATLALTEPSNDVAIRQKLIETEDLMDHISDFISRLNRESMTESASDSIILLLETVSRYRSSLQDLHEWLDSVGAKQGQAIEIPTAIRESIGDFLIYSDPLTELFSPADSRRISDEIHQLRKQYRQDILGRAADNEVKPKQVLTILSTLSTMDNFTHHFSKSLVTIEKALNSFSNGLTKPEVEHSEKIVKT